MGRRRPAALIGVLVVAFVAGDVREENPSPPRLLEDDAEITGKIADAPWLPGPDLYRVTVPGSSVEGGQTPSLYPANGEVSVLTGDVLMNEVDKAENEWIMVEAYSHSCPHCWYVVPEVTKVVKAYAGEEDFKVLTLNCYAAENNAACASLMFLLGTNAFPTFGLCPPKAVAPEIPTATTEFINSAQPLFREALTKLTRCTKLFVNPKPVDGGSDLISAEDLSTWIVAETRLFPIHPEELRKGADFEGNDGEMEFNEPGAPPGKPGWASDDLQNQPGILAWTSEHRQADAILGFMSLLYRGYRSDRHAIAVDTALALSNAIPSKDLDELVQFLQTTPPKRDQMAFNVVFKRWADAAKLSTVFNAVELSTTPFVTCHDETCAIWTIMHIVITARAVRGATDDDLKGESPTQTKFGLTIKDCMAWVRDFVDAFLSCGPCKTSFLQEFDACAYGRCDLAADDWRGLSLWMWRHHNAVSLSVAKKTRISADRRWPMYVDCPSCWDQKLVLEGTNRRLDIVPLTEAATTPAINAIFTVEQLDSAFETTNVFWFLVNVYVGLTRAEVEGKDLTKAEKDEMLSGLYAYSYYDDTLAVAPNTLREGDTSHARSGMVEADPPSNESPEGDNVDILGAVGEIVDSAWSISAKICFVGLFIISLIILGLSSMGRLPSSGFLFRARSGFDGIDHRPASTPMIVHPRRNATALSHDHDEELIPAQDDDDIDAE
eukprot:TRINITY_DN30119_c0_g1_i1.p1 TRINITY_DN30119_c0_g1~~TRINITY_DN30119_c0_g1_i1.p1  ORF type:complete len:720 (+),score=118.09 TRINITY_DN30119_c0_g1_i1:56-2215(+)